MEGNLKNSILSSFVPGNGAGTVTDHVVDPYDDTLVCAHCLKKIYPACTGALWRQACDCQGAVEFVEKRKELDLLKRDLEGKLSRLKTEAEEKMLETYKTVYSARIQDRKAEMEKIDQKILGYKLEDLWA